MNAISLALLLALSQSAKSEDEALRIRLQAPNPQLRIAALKELRTSGSIDHFHQTVQLAFDPSPAVRFHAGEVLEHNLREFVDGMSRTSGTENRSDTEKLRQDLARIQDAIQKHRVPLSLGREYPKLYEIANGDAGTVRRIIWGNLMKFAPNEALDSEDFGGGFEMCGNGSRPIHAEFIVAALSYSPKAVRTTIYDYLASARTENAASILYELHPGLGDPIPTPVLDHLTRSPSEDVRSQVASYLGSAPVRDAVGRLQRLANDRHAAVRGQAIRSLSARVPGHAARIVASRFTAMSQGERRAMVSVLEMCEDPAVGKAFLPLLAKAQDRALRTVVMDAIEILGKLRVEEAVPNLLRLESEGELRESALVALAQIDPRIARPRILSALSLGRPTRDLIAGIRAAARTEDAAFLPPLRMLRTHPDAEVRGEVEYAIDALASSEQNIDSATSEKS